MKKYTFYEDPGHGWLEVPMTELVELGIADVITPCSYMTRDYVAPHKLAYLEEDCDLTTFLVAKIYDYVPKDWKDACCKMNGEEARKWYAENVDHNDRATLRGAPEIFVRRLPNYAA